MGIFNVVNTSISGAVVAIGVFLKDWLKDKQIKNFKLVRLLPLFLLIISEILNIVYGYTQGENIMISVSNGIISALTATYGYDVVKAVMKNGVKDA